MPPFPDRIVMLGILILLRAASASAMSPFTITGTRTAALPCATAAQSATPV